MKTRYSLIAIAAISTTVSLAPTALLLTLAAPAPPVHTQAPGCDFVPADILIDTPALQQTILLFLYQYQESTEKKPQRRDAKAQRFQCLTTFQ